MYVFIIPDHEVSALHKLKLIATDGGDVPLSNDVIAFILVEDANDHDPVFDQQVNYFMLIIRLPGSI